MNHQSFSKLLVDKCILLSSHRDELKQKRGFSDELIDKMHFRSSGEYLFDGNYLSSSDIEMIHEDDKRTLQGAKVIIPYFAKDNSIFYSRIHKMGFKGRGLEIYVPWPLLRGLDTNRIVIAESEFKAAASCAMGVAAIGIPGINTYCKNKFEELTDVLQSIGCKEVVICFDNEIKDNPAYPNFKPDYTKRFDAEIYAYIMAKKIERAGYTTSIATLKKAWMIDGKADIDGVLSQGIPHSEYQALINNALPGNAYRFGLKLSKIQRSYVERRIDRFFYNGNITEEFQCYYRRVEKKVKNKIETVVSRISNFIIKIDYTVINNEKAERYCQLISRYGNSQRIILKPDMMVSKSQFQKLCFELGDFEFYGNDSDLAAVWSYIFMHQDGRIINKINYLGYHSDINTWFFFNGAYRNEQFYPADENKLIWIEDAGFMLPHSTRDDENVLLPELTDENTNIDIKKIFYNLSKVFNEKYARVVLGWTLGNFFMQEILKEYGVYPFLFFYGLQSAGKSSLANWISSFFGFTQKGVPFSMSSLVGITRAAANLSMIPIWLEEYRNTSDSSIGKKNSLLRSIYDKSTILKGNKTPGALQTYTSRSTLILSGEDQPLDAALNSRCVMIPVFDRRHSDLEAFQWLHNNASQFNTIGHHILLNKKMYWDKIKLRIDEYFKAFLDSDKKVDTRNRKHMSIVAGVGDVFLDSSIEFMEFIGTESIKRTASVDHSQALYIFLEDVINLKNTFEISFPFLELIQNRKTRKHEVAFYFNGVYNFWERRFARLRESIPASKQALLEHIRSEPYYIEERAARLDNSSRRCIILNPQHKSFPADLRIMLETDSNKSLFEDDEVY
jgi:DNA primase